MNDEFVDHVKCDKLINSIIKSKLGYEKNKRQRVKPVKVLRYTGRKFGMI